MANKKLLLAVRELLNTVHKNVAEVTAEIKKQKQELAHDYICGGWTHVFDGTSATIIKLRTGYMATIFRDGFIIEQVFIMADGELLHINGSDGGQLLPVIHDPERHTIMIGRYGKFDRDHEAIMNPQRLCEEESDIVPLPSGNVIEYPRKPGRKPKTDKID